MYGVFTGYGGGIGIFGEYLLISFLFSIQCLFFLLVGGHRSVYFKLSFCHIFFYFRPYRVDSFHSHVFVGAEVVILARDLFSLQYSSKSPIYYGIETVVLFFSCTAMSGFSSSS